MSRAGTDQRERPLRGEAIVDAGGDVWLPYDLPHLRVDTVGWSLLSQRREVLHAGRREFRLDIDAHNELHVLNAMGVVLGDSVIGMGVLAWLKSRRPSLRIHVYRSPHVPAYVERLYRLASAIIEPVHYLPQSLQSLPAEVIDLSDFLFWPRFANEPMVDFFVAGIGVEPAAMPASAKANRWLADLRLPALPAAWTDKPYVLFCDRASTPLRSIPREQANLFVERIWQHYRLPVVGFRDLVHAHWHDISGLSPTTEQFLAWVKGAQAVIGTDSSAVHLAAGFDIPTLAGFISIDPALRVRDYPRCRAVDLRTPLTDGMQSSDDADVLQEVDQSWRRFLQQDTLPWPELSLRNLGR